MDKSTVPASGNSTDLPSVKKQKQTGTRLAMMLALISLLLSIVVLVGGTWFGQRIYSNQIRIVHNLEAIMTNLSQTQASLSQQQQSLATTQQKLQQLIQSADNESTQSILAETESLIKLAQFNLTFQGDPELALRLLTLADENIKNLSDPTLLGLRQALANDIAKVNALPRIDKGGLITRINALSQQVAQLPVIPEQKTESNNQNASAIPTATKAWWKRVPSAVLDNLKDVVIIRSHQQPIGPLLSPTQQTYLIQNIQIKLSLAQWAVLHRQASVYQQSLHQALTWIQQYFAQNASVTQSIIASLNELLTVDVQPKLPDLSDSLQAIQNAEAKLNH